MNLLNLDKIKTAYAKYKESKKVVYLDLNDIWLDADDVTFHTELKALDIKFNEFITTVRNNATNYILETPVKYTVIREIDFNLFRLSYADKYKFEEYLDSSLRKCYYVSR